MTPLLFVVLAILMAILTLVSYTDRVYTEMGKFLSREFQENIEAFEQRVEPRLGVNRDRAALSMSLVKHMSMAAIAVLIAYQEFHGVEVTSAEILEVVVGVVLVIIVCQHLLPFIFFSRTKGDWVSPLAPVLRALIYLTLPVTLILGFCLSVAALSRDYAEPEPERPSEAVDALIEAGQDEGIIEESDRDLIHSVIEFGDKMVREVMTPRPNIIAVPAETTIAEFTDLLRENSYSRVPVYEGSIDNIVGIIFSHDVLQVPDTEAHTRRVSDLMSRDVHFVPETRRGGELLREMQRENVRMAIVIDEYGGVAGLVTIEDLVEEIVGELRDEDEARDVVREKDHSFTVSGRVDVDRLEKIFGIRRGDWEATTVGGLVTEFAGHIPSPGEVVEIEGLRFEVLQSTQRRVERVRISVADPEAVHQPPNPQSNRETR